ncbi:MAG TPA: outer membrane beta-barrel protein [Bacteroidota bacterium]|nr:outer membrane beta-barrel protein [Bacteroidota bacterium]
MHRIATLALALLVVAIPLHAQLDAPMVNIPLSLDLGLGGGVSVPSGDLSNSNNTGYHAGGKLRIHGPLPFNIVAGGMYNNLPEKVGDKSDNQIIVGAGIEVGIPSVAVQPYFGADVLYLRFNNEGTGTSSFNRGGLALGAGVEFVIPAFGSFDTSVKYQFMNLMGKKDTEPTASQIVATVAVMIGLI